MAQNMFGLRQKGSLTLIIQQIKYATIYVTGSGKIQHFDYSEYIHVCAHAILLSILAILMAVLQSTVAHRWDAHTYYYSKLVTQTLKMLNNYSKISILLAFSRSSHIHVYP